MTPPVNCVVNDTRPHTNTLTVVMRLEGFVLCHQGVAATSYQHGCFGQRRRLTKVRVSAVLLVHYDSRLVMVVADEWTLIGEVGVTVNVFVSDGKCCAIRIHANI